MLFSLILLFLPVNLAKHFFFDFAYVDGILVDYLIPTVYLTDILIWGLLGVWAFREIREYRGNRGDRWGFFKNPLILYSLFFILISGLSVLSAPNQPAAVYKWLKLVEYVLFAFYITKNTNLKKDFSTIVKLLAVGVLLESALAIAQWFKQGSILGYYFFGENRYTVSTPGIATLDLMGIRKARPYGTFPHPNVLGGYLAVLLPWIFYEGIKGVKGGKGLKERRFYLLTFGLGLVALALSFSRPAWVVGGLGVAVVLLLDSRRRFLFPVFLHSSFLIPNSLSFLRRAELNWMALQMLKDHPLFGVGLNNFTVRMSEYGEVSGWIRFLQPAHNVYLLIAAETGLLGLAAFLCLLFSAFRFLWRGKKDLLLISLSQVTLLCFVDHYFFTLPQTSLLFWLVLGLGCQRGARLVYSKRDEDRRLDFEKGPGGKRSLPQRNFPDD